MSGILKKFQDDGYDGVGGYLRGRYYTNHYAWYHT